jgi:hypothetical protein
MARLLTQAQYARKTKYSRARITQLVKQGVIILKNGKVDQVQAEAAITANIDRSRQSRSEKKSKSQQSPQMSLLQNVFNTDHQNGTKTNGFNTDQKTDLPSLTEVKRDHEIKKMKKTELEIKVKLGQLVPKEETIKMVVALGTAIKLALLNFPRRLAPTLKTLTDEKEIEIYLRSEIKKVIQILEQAHAKSKRSGSKDSKRHLAGNLETAR